MHLCLFFHRLKRADIAWDSVKCLTVVHSIDSDLTLSEYRSFRAWFLLHSYSNGVLRLFFGGPMRNKSLLLMTAFLFISIPTFADVELKEQGEGYIRIGQPANDTWLVEDEVCIVRDGNTLGCGRVTQSETDGAIVRVGDTAQEILPGDRVQSYLEIQEENTRAIITAGVMAGFGYHFPHIHIQYRLNENWFIGAMGSLSSNEELGRDITHKGLFLTANSYSRYSPFRGFWFRVGAGAYLLDVKNSVQTESATSPALLSTVGWRGYLGGTVTIGLGVGLQYIPNQINTVPLGLRELEPLGTLDIGIRF